MIRQIIQRDRDREYVSLSSNQDMQGSEHPITMKQDAPIVEIYVRNVRRKFILYILMLAPIVIGVVAAVSYIRSIFSVPFLEAVEKVGLVVVILGLGIFLNRLNKEVKRYELQTFRAMKRRERDFFKGIRVDIATQLREPNKENKLNAASAPRGSRSPHRRSRSGGKR